MLKKLTIPGLVFLALALVMPCSFGSYAGQRFSDMFSRGNGLYQKGDFAAAEGVYRSILDAGVESGPLYYNLGNACFKEKKLGESIYYWEKALRLLPAAREIRENLDLANLMVVDRIEVPAPPFLLRSASYLKDLLTINQGTWLVLSLFAAINALFAASLLTKDPRTRFRARTATVLLSTLFLFAACLFGWKAYDEYYRREAVVIEETVDVRSGPALENITVFTVHQGIKVEVQGESEGWCQVSLPNGWSGWLKQSSIRIL